MEIVRLVLAVTSIAAMIIAKVCAALIRYEEATKSLSPLCMELCALHQALSPLERSFTSLGPSVDSHCRASSIKSSSLDYITEIAVLVEDLRGLTEESETTVFASNRRINVTGLFLAR